MRVLVVVKPEEPSHQQFYSRLSRLIETRVNKDTSLEIKTIKTEDLTEILDLSSSDSLQVQIILDLCADITTFRPLIKPSCHHVFVGGFAKACFHPLTAASGIQEVSERCPHTDLAIVSRDEHHTWSTWLHAAIPTLRNWRHNQRQLVTACADYCFLWLCMSHPYDHLKTCGQPVECHGLRLVKSSSMQHFLIALRYNYDRILSRLYRAIKPTPHWCIGYVKSWEHSDPTYVKLTSSKGPVWYADPFVWSDDRNRCWILCEQFDELGDGLGKIALLEVRQSQPPVNHGVILKEPFHLSFPRLVEYEQSLYATVESCDNHDVRLYKVNSIDQPMILERILLQGESFIDPILIHHQDDRWYLLVSTTSVGSIKREVAPELRLFVSDDLLHGQFSEHPQSPLLISSRGGRNAGLIHQGSLYRVAQQTGFGGVYGESIIFFRIDDLSPTSYSETPVQHLPTGFQPSRFRKKSKASHFHSLNNHGDQSVFDFIPS